MLAQARDTVPAPGALPGELRFQPKFDGSPDTLEASHRGGRPKLGPSAFLPSSAAALGRAGAMSDPGRSVGDACKEADAVGSRARRKRVPLMDEWDALVPSASTVVRRRAAPTTTEVVIPSAVAPAPFCPAA
ncbi:hypothetical protein GCM10010274_65280 [Streptomyces lavendofoliae]|uniref:Uncharacterized protein n=1 Tax=Streptomyces lavendofoliae TaxID=67314 RepID=A0A918I497_9ACTN|nr:hypothetical protein GCM10010274_65280 [Streptomyces lavendofoliae]